MPAPEGVMSRAKHLQARSYLSKGLNKIQIFDIHRASQPLMGRAGTPDITLYSSIRQRADQQTYHFNFNPCQMVTICDLTSLATDSFDFAQDFRLRFSNSRLPAPSSSIVAGSGVMLKLSISIVPAV